VRLREIQRAVLGVGRREVRRLREVRDFRRWHPGFNQAPPPAALTAQPPRFVPLSYDCRGVPAL